MESNYEKTFSYIWSNKPHLKILLKNANYHMLNKIDQKQVSDILILTRTIYGYSIDISEPSYDKNLFNPLEVNTILNKQFHQLFVQIILPIISLIIISLIY